MIIDNILEMTKNGENDIIKTANGHSISHKSYLETNVYDEDLLLL